MASSIFSGMEDFGLGDMSTADIFKDPAAEEKKKKAAEAAAKQGNQSSSNNHIRTNITCCFRLSCD